MAADKTYNVGIIGYGLSAKVFHIPFVPLIPNLKLHSILQRSPSSSSSAPADHPTLHHFTTLDTFLSDPSLDLVVITTPPDTHYPFAHAALSRGKHVLVEKPFVPTPKEADALVQLARTKDLLLCVYQNRRFDADFLTVQSLIREGRLGERITEFESHFDRLKIQKPSNWKGQLPMSQAGGVLYDLGTHLLDQVYVLFGGVPTSVYAKFTNQREGRFVTGLDGDEPDSINVVLTYAKTGTLVHVRSGILSVEKPQPRFWVRGSRGSYHKEGLDQQEPQLLRGMKTSDPAFGRDEPGQDGRLYTLNDKGEVEEKPCPNVEPATYTAFYKMLGQALQSGKEADLPVPAGQAADVLRIIEAVKESAAKGQEVKMV